MASETPLNITLSLGDVIFNLTPSSPSPPPLSPHHEQFSSSSPRPSPPSEQRRSSPYYSSHRKRQYRRRNGLERSPSYSRQHEQQCGASSPPFLAIRHGSSQSPAVSTPNNSSNSASFSSSLSAMAAVMPTPPQSPLQRHILGRVRMMKDKIETTHQESSRRNITGTSTPPLLQQSPLFSPRNSSNTGGGGDYCVDLNSFTGTLHISSNLNNAGAQPTMQGATPRWGNNKWDRTANRSSPSPSSRPMFSKRNVPESTRSMQNNATPRWGNSRGENQPPFSRSSPSPRTIFHSQKQGAANNTTTNHSNPSPSPRKRLARSSTGSDPDYNLSDSVILSKKRTRRFTWIAPNEEEVEMGTNDELDSWEQDPESSDNDKDNDATRDEQASSAVDQSANNSDDPEKGIASERTDSSLSQGMHDSRKSSKVRFSMHHQDSIINPTWSSEEESATGDDPSNLNVKPPSGVNRSARKNGSIGKLGTPKSLSFNVENNFPNNDTNVMQSPLDGTQQDSFQSHQTQTNNNQYIDIMKQNASQSSQQQQQPEQQHNNVQQQQPLKSKSNHFFSSPPGASYSSPPRAARASAKSSMNFARGTSSALAKSGRHVLKQITLAGKDAYDVINVDNAFAYGKRASAGSPTGSAASSRSGRGAFLGDNHHDEEDVYDAFDGTELHYACASSSLAHIKCLLEYDALIDLHKQDCFGKLPIHVFAENRDLINKDPIGCEEVAFTMIELMGPEKAVHSLHPCGLAPFAYVIGEWAQSLHSGAVTGNSILASAAATRGSRKVPAQSIAAKIDEERANNDNPQSRRKRVTYRSLFHSSILGPNHGESLLSSTDRAKLLYLPPSVTISDHVRWAIRILSRLIDDYPEQTREAILTNIASIPLFLKSLLLIGDVDDMTELLDMSLVKHTIIDKRSINVWLCAMLMDTKEVKLRAVTFIRLLSRLTLHDLAASSQSPDRYSDKEVERFTTLRTDTFNAVYVMPGIVPAVLELGGHMIENISTTAVMRYITDRTIRKESVFFVLICDFFYSVFILMGYRLNVEFVLNYQSVDGPEHYRESRYISMSTMGIATYFLFKEAITLLSLYLTSKKLAKRYCLSVWNIIDVAAVALLLGSETVLTIPSDPAFLDNEGYVASLIIILLWLKLMGAFKILNKAFSLFLYAVHEVIKEVKWFLMFLFAVTLMFSDAARTVVAARGECYNLAEDDYITEDFCSDNLLSVIIRMYSVLVGDVALEYFQSSDTMVTVFILFSFFSITILLNILIAIIIDSYEGSKRRSREIFYRARIEYAAHLVARKQFLRPRELSDFHVATYVPQKMRFGLRIVYSLVSATAFLSFEYGFFGASHFLALENKHDYRMIQSLVIIYVVVGAIFNLYVLSMASIALFSRYDQRFYGLNWLAENQHTFLHSMVKKAVGVLKMAVKLFHSILGFNADQGTVSISEEILITGDEGEVLV